MSAFAVFAAMARSMNATAREHGLDTVGFRTSPRMGDRTIRHREDGSSTVAVSVRSRPDQMVAYDMGLGLALVNGFTGWPTVLVAVFLAQAALELALPERTFAALRSARVIDPALLHC